MQIFTVSWYVLRVVRSKLNEYTINIKDWICTLITDAKRKFKFGFRKKPSTDDAIYKLTHEILTALNNKEIVGSIFFDLSKAFDSVDHTILTNKLPYYGITGKTKSLIESYLTNRFQSTQLHYTYLELKTTSEWTKIKHGVPQRSILWPLLFILYINDLPKSLSPNHIPVLLADDTSIIISTQNRLTFKNELKETFANISNWFQANSFSLKKLNLFNSFQKITTIVTQKYP